MRYEIKLVILIIIFFPLLFSQEEKALILSKIKQSDTATFEKQDNEISVDLKNPILENSVLSTHEGGVIQNKDLRIQARSLEYTRKTDRDYLIHRLVAHGDLMIQYKGRVFTGEQIEYDFSTGSGIIYEGKTYTSPWYFGGNTIHLYPDGSFSVNNAYVTTCESEKSSWDIYASNVKVSKNDLFEAKHLRFRLLKTPMFYLPFWRMNLQRFGSKKPIIDYQVNWDKKAGPRLSLRYQAYSWRDFSLFLRGDWRMKRGLGAAIETEYLPKDKDTSFLTKNYIATDVLPNDPKKKRRYRLQGSFDSTSPSKKTSIHATWDKFSDKQMPDDFEDKDFEIQTEKVTEFFIRHQENDLIALLHTKPRINYFDSVEQDLPTIFLSIKPISIPHIGIINNNWSKFSYLDYTYARNAPTILSKTRLVRLETYHQIYRPFFLGPVSITPLLGVIGVYYGNKPDNSSKDGLGVIKYGGDIRSSFYKNYKIYKHLIQPYIIYEGLTDPTINLSDHFILSEEDGFNQINKLQIGLKNQWFNRENKIGVFSWDIDIYSDAFFGQKKIPLTFPYLFFDLSSHLSSLSFSCKNAWNFIGKTLDYTILKLGWTLNTDFAFSVEFRYRSRFHWRKADHSNYLMEISREQGDLLLSPLSDKRNTILTNFFIRLNPRWTCHLQSHHGWNRSGEPSYNEFKVDLETLLSTSWKLSFSYEHTLVDDKVSMNISLLSKKKERSISLPKTSIPSLLPKREKE